MALKDFVCVNNKQGRTQGAGPAFSRLLPIGPRAKGSYKLTFSIECVCVMLALGSQYFLSLGPVAIENENELRCFLTSSIIILRSINRNTGNCFSAIRVA